MSYNGQLHELDFLLSDESDSAKQNRNRSMDRGEGELLYPFTAK